MQKLLHDTENKKIKEMKKILIQIGLFVVIVALSYFVYSSIMEPVRFSKEKLDRESHVIQRLKDIRSSQFIFKQLSGAYAQNFDTLISFLNTAEIPIVKIIPDPSDTTFTLTINDTIGYVNVGDTLFGTRPNFKTSQIKVIPFSIFPVCIKLSPNTNIPYPLKGSSEPNQLIIFFGEILSVESFCSAKYLILLILG
jgi:hypothetical protein